MADRDQALAAEPGFHDGSPGDSEGAVISGGHGLDGFGKLGGEQSQNPFSGFAMQAQPEIGIVIDLAGCFAIKAAARAVVEVRGPWLRRK